MANRCLLVILAGLTALSAGCGEAPSAGKVFTLNNSDEPETLDPALMTGLPEVNIASGLYEGLIALTPDTLMPAPGVAEKWEISPDGLSYTFHLRDAKWSNGEPLTARDFVYSWQRVLARETAASYAYQLFYVKNARAFNAGKITDFAEVGVKAIDDRTLQVRLVSATPFFLELCSFPTLAPVHRTAIETHGDKWTRPGNFVGNGAFILADWKPQQHVLLKKNPLYWDADGVKLDTVRILAILDPETAWKSYAYGDTDWIRTMPRPRLTQLRERDDFSIATGLGVHFYRFNVTRKPFSDPRVRKALNLAIDKRQIAELLEGGEQPARSYVPPGVHGYTPVEGPDCDPDRARKLLADAGFPGGEGFPTFKLLYNTNETHRVVAQRVQKMWQKELNINVELVNQGWKVYLNSLDQLDYDMARSSWIGDYNDANTFLDMFITGGGNNRTGWSNRHYDKLIARAANTLDPKERERAFQEAERILIDGEMPVMPLYYDVNHTLVKPRIGGFYPNIRNFHPLKHIFIRE